MKKYLFPVVSAILLLVFITLVVADNRASVSSEVMKSKPNSALRNHTVAVKVPQRLTPNPVKGIYSTSWIAGSSRMNQIIDFIKATEVNALVIDLKDDTGILSYQSQVPLATEIGANSKRAPNLKDLVSRLKQQNVYPIARIVVFKDPLLAKQHPEIAVRDKNGGIWRDRKGMTWVDPHNRLVWKYNLDIAKEAVAMGFAEVQFDYVRFVSDGKISNCVYPFSKGELKEDIIRDFLLYARKDLHAMGVPISADIFGLVLSVPDDLNIGQQLEKIASAVDYISPMVYPSHYPKGTFGIQEPDLHPYEVVFEALKRGNKRIAGSQAKFRPWLQDFDLGNPYGRTELAAQIKALNANGISDWLFWNPGNHYKLEEYQGQ